VSGGQRLREFREKLGLSIRDVETASAQLAEKYGTPDYAISLSRLSDIETKEITPNIYKIYSLAAIYRRSFREILGLYGIEPSNAARDAEVIKIARTHPVSTFDSIDSVMMPTQVDPAFDHRTTTVIGRMIVNWGVVPLARLEQFKTRNYTYGYIGTDDLTMSPLLLPGSFVQIDETKRKIEEGPWRSEYERPIYFLETREGFLCSWCEWDPPSLVTRPHPMSPARGKSYRLGSEIEVLGQVVGIAMRLRGWLDRETPRPE
jgi:transcriptional regulator with XRE-family HTH domain